jgi:hypothetical protein
MFSLNWFTKIVKKKCSHPSKLKTTQKLLLSIKKKTLFGGKLQNKSL